MLKVVPSVNKKFVLKKNSTKFSNVFLIYLLFVVQSLSCVRLFCDPIDHSLPVSSVRGISQARILEWVAISCSQLSWDLSNSGIECASPASAGRFFMTEPPGKPNSFFTLLLICIIIFRYDTELHIKIQNSLENKQFGDLRCENSAL